MAMIQVEVKKNKAESTQSLLRRFTKRTQGSGVVKKAKSLRFQERQKSTFVKKKEALRRIKRKKEFERLVKLGKINVPFYKKSR